MELGKNDKKGCVTMLRIKDDFKTMEYYRRNWKILKKESSDLEITLIRKTHQDYILQWA